MLGLGIGHNIPFIAYLGFWVACVLSLTKQPLWGLYYLIPFIPYRTMRDHFDDYFLGQQILTVLILCILVGALLHGKKLPKSGVFLAWLVSGVYLYMSMWVGVAMMNAPVPLWLNDINFVTWKDYMLIPLTLVAASMVVEDRKAVRTVVLLTAFSVLMIDRSCLMESLSRSWGTFDENKRDPGPLATGANQTAAYLANFSMFFWGFAQYVKTKKYRLMFYGLVAATVFADLYTFSRASYIALVAGMFLLGILKDRKLLILGVVFLITWQAILPAAVQQRINMTEDSNGQLEASAQERVNLWQNAQEMFARSPIFGSGYATYQMNGHVDGLRDTHNWYVKVAVETGLIGLALALWLIAQMVLVSWRLYRKTDDPLYKGLGLGLVLAIFSCVITNFFGDRWTYFEITAPLWVLVGAGAKALTFKPEAETAQAVVEDDLVAVNPYMAYR